MKRSRGRRAASGDAEVLELLERLVFDLANALAGDVERAPDLVERARVLATEAVAQLEHAPLAVAEILERIAQSLLGQELHGNRLRARRMVLAFVGPRPVARGDP